MEKSVVSVFPAVPNAKMLYSARDEVAKIFNAGCNKYLLGREPPMNHACKTGGLG